MAQNKTIETEASVAEYIEKIGDEKRRQDFSALVELIAANTGFEPKMWGEHIVGFGSYHYKYETGREGDAPLFALASRASSITFYLGSEFENREELMSKFGKYKVSGGCFHVKKLDDIDTAVLIEMVENSIEQRKKEHSC
jgi:Domain of unknown function (DU1801)